MAFGKKTFQFRASRLVEGPAKEKSRSHRDRSRNLNLAKKIIPSLTSGMEIASLQRLANPFRCVRGRVDRVVHIPRPVVVPQVVVGIRGIGANGQANHVRIAFHGCVTSGWYWVVTHQDFSSPLARLTEEILFLPAFAFSTSPFDCSPDWPPWELSNPVGIPHRQRGGFPDAGPLICGQW
jgi:hypothetical protein